MIVTLKIKILAKKITATNLMCVSASYVHMSYNSIGLDYTFRIVIHVNMGRSNIRLVNR